MRSNLTLYHYFLIHLASAFVVFLGMYSMGVFEALPSNLNLIQWDSGWYKSIVEHGYVFKENTQSNTGFFPFFPFLWKYLGLSAVGVSIFNFIFFLTGIFIISKTVPLLKNKVVLLSLSFPSLIFMYVPYSEALFFLTASMYLYGNHQSNNYLKVAALLLSSFARPTIFFFLPAVIFSEFLGTDKISAKIKAIVGYSLVIVIGTFISFYIVGANSGNLFAYSDSQINNWEHSFSLPNFPLTTWRGYRILWLDLLGLWVVISALIGAIIYFIKALQRKMKISFDKNTLLSLSYLSMILIYVLFFHPKEESTGLTSILSLNRYVFCSPFVFYLMYYFFTNQKQHFTRVLGISLLLSVLLIGFPLTSVVGLDYLKTLAFVAIAVLFLVAQVVPKLTNAKLAYFMVYGMNLTLQVYLFQSFLKGNWIG